LQLEGGHSGYRFQGHFVTLNNYFVRFIALIDISELIHEPTR